jgi:tetratricopeptide (TPR) repeat protein
MRNFLIVLLAAAAAAACNNNAPRPVANSGNAAAPAANEKPQTAIAHTTENQNPDSASGKSKWTQGGDPVDTTEFDAAISQAEKASTAKPSDTAAKKALADAYIKRADALTKSRQYAAALGDYRRALKADPSNETAKQWVEQITSIYASINRESPKEGEEPPPLPFKK